ncbi:MAG: hypothetical protein HY619_04035 [Thaumarchaeota archaeon]|nr:hypothetical protein [Nitrososphaerota archaeon]
MLSKTLTTASGSTVNPQQVLVNISLPFREPIAELTLTYQMNAIEQVLNHYKISTGSKELTTGQLDRMLKELSLRDGINPTFEPLSISKVLPALAELQKQGFIRITGEGKMMFN